ncbi:conserved hypothetical protein [Vibrio nigripulchritudo SFn27]|uniref:GlyGly-CTERM sorting domain-containing protein n=1 Tax=Vibrio nigripulchritudo TaxID=28173 RepID=U4KFJ3_9VIBR|nr:DUF3466 family protein [Vibrio nigripulchritudo]CCN84108.1 conserved hypothetical protein [Vibrio nigripulchritudo BLFn1]CCN87023.1 conserved hypothetical protein [Vibrio nigripulchritudo SFn27]CCN93272.1 conserved hypothetical protein [Vibrio nigripulchritudo ENn2]CCO39438.1 conserved hypothetical protein [Vibrio nigripulchritudo SFn135]CCO54281.1 conserved hypothetical protein [Vibrio nigripulchritudo Wn13]
MSRNKVFKLSAIASLVIGATSAQAALYNIEVVEQSQNENFGSAISEVSTVTNCFTEDCASANPKVASRGRIGEAGQWINDEMDFLFDNRFRFVDQTSNRDEYRKYCDYNLRYNTCEAWADRFFYGTNDSGGARRVLNSFSWPTPFTAANNNTKAFVTGGVSLISEVSGNITGTNEIVVNNFDGDTAIGNSSSGYMHTGSSNFARQYKSRGFYGTTALEPIVTSQPLDTMGVTRAFDSFEYNGKKYVVGSSAFSIFGDKSDCETVSDPHTKAQCQNLRFNNQAVVWDVTNTGAITVSKVTDTSTGTQSYQASVRAATINPNDSNKPVLVGYYNRKNSSDMLPEAAVFLPTFDTGGEINGWSTKAISGTTLNPDGYIYHNSVATDVNQNLLVIGNTKRGNYDYKRSRTDVPVEEGSLNNRLWVANASSSSPSATYLSGGIFFAGAGGDMRSVNDFNEIVGRIDAENVREVDGKIRRKRGFIFPYAATGITGNRSGIFQNRAWWLDDLTNDGSVGGNNNQFRIIDANDINNAGIISASAMMCAGGYKTTSHNASCDGTEKLVSVKLTPINGATAANIQQRTADKDPVERKGAGVGILLLAALSLISFRRK